MTSHLDVVFLDVGGPLYEDGPYYRALWRAIREARPDADEDEYWAEFRACRDSQRGPFTTRLVRRFVDEPDVERVVLRGKELWEYPPSTLQPDAKRAVEALSGTYRLGVLANQERWIRDVLARDGLAPFFDVWAVSAEVGAEKPDERIFRAALEAAGAPADRCAMVGDRLDNDIEPAKRLGMRGIWLLRGEAPDEPSEDQLSRADLAIRTLDDLPEALRSL